MEKLVYKNYTITPDAIQDERTGEYAPTVHIAWGEHDSKQDSYSFTFRVRYSTFTEALAMALEQAKEWADHWLLHVRP